MIIDCRQWGQASEEQIRQERSHVFVDGVEIHLVWYLDTDLGLVETYDVLRDGKVKRAIAFDTEHLEEMRSQGRMIGAPIDGVLSEIIWGKVELIPYE